MNLTVTVRSLDRPSLTVTPVQGPAVRLAAPAPRVVQTNVGVPGPRGEPGLEGPPGQAPDLTGIGLDGGYF